MGSLEAHADLLNSQDLQRYTFRGSILAHGTFHCKLSLEMPFY